MDSPKHILDIRQHPTLLEHYHRMMNPERTPEQNPLDIQLHGGGIDSIKARERKALTPPTPKHAFFSEDKITFPNTAKKAKTQ